MAIDTEERTGNTPAPTADTGGSASEVGAASATGGANNNKKIVIIVLSIVGALVILGIVSTMVMAFIGKKVVEGGIEAATGGQVKIDTDSNDGSVTIESDDGTSSYSAGGKELPEDYPTFTPDVYDGAQLMATSRTVVDGTSRFSASYDVPGASISEAIRYYEAEAEKIGLKVSTTTQTDNTGMLIASEEVEDGEEGRSLMVSMNAEEGEPLRLIVAPMIRAAE